MVGEYLAGLGFTDIDATDLSDVSLDIAKKKASSFFFTLTR